MFITTTGAVDAFSPSGRPLWHEKVGVESYSSSSVSPGGLLYFGDNRGELHVLESANGHQVAAHRLGTHGLWGGQAVRPRGDVYTGTQSGAIYGIGPGGRQLFRVQASGPIDSYPALTGNGVLIAFGDQSGTVYAMGEGPMARWASPAPVDDGQSVISDGWTTSLHLSWLSVSARVSCGRGVRPLPVSPSTPKGRDAYQC